MRLSKVRIKNFKGIKDWEIALKPGFNLIKGTNGKGKTSILEAIAVGMGGFLTGVAEISGRNFIREEIRREYILSGDGSYTCLYKIPVEIELTAQFDGNDEVFWNRRLNSTTPGRGTLQPNTIKKLAEEKSNSAFTPLPIINYQGASRIWAQKKEKVDDIFRKQYFRTVGYTDTLEEASNIKLLLNWCLKMEQTAFQKNQKIAEYEAVKDAVGRFMGLMDHGEAYSVFYDRQQEGLLYKEGDSVLPVSDLSAGYQSLIWMVLDIAYRMAVLNPFMKEHVAESGGVVLIDELDMHLHPKWQWKVINALRGTFPNVQFIAATHSPILFASARDVWVIDIDHDQISYVPSHYGIDINTSVSNYQGTTYLPEELEQLVADITDDLDNMDYQAAQKKLDRLSRLADSGSPIVTALQTRLEMETTWEDD